MSYTTTQVIDSFVGSYSKGSHQPIQGSEVSVNMVREQNGEIVYQKSLNGKKFVTKITDTGFCRGSYKPSVGSDTNNHTARLFAVIGQSLYSYNYNGIVETIIDGDLMPDTTICFAESGGERPFLLLSDEVNLYAINLYDNSVNKIIMPTNITGDLIKPSSVAVLAGSIAISDKNTGYVYYSDPYILSSDTRKILVKNPDGTIAYDDDNLTPLYEEVDTWTHVFVDKEDTLQYKNAESSSDSVTYLKVIGSILVVFGVGTIEFWTRGDSEKYQTWNRVSYTNLNELGLASTTSVASTNEHCYFIGTGTKNGTAVYKITKTNVEKISPLWLDRILSEHAITGGFTNNNEIGFAYTDSIHEYYCLTIDDEMFGYDAWSGDWYKRCSSENAQTYHKSKYTCPSFFEGKLYFFSNENGCLFIDSPDYFKEDWSDTNIGRYFIRCRETPVILDNYKKFIASELTIETNVGECEVNSKPRIGLQISKDGGKTFGNFLYNYLPRTGEYYERVRFSGLGECRLLVIRVFTTDPIDLLFSNASLRICPLGERM